MKTVFFSLAVATLVFGLTGCKKSKKEEDISPLFQNTVWTGELRYDNIPVPEPFCIIFDGFGKFTMEERTGTSYGIYFIEKASSAVTIQMAKGTFQAVISNKQFSKITYNGTYAWSIHSAELNDDPLQGLNSTLWKGNQLTPPNTQQPWQVRFITDKLLNINEGPSNFSYTRSDVNIRIDFLNNGYYFVLQPHNKIKGIFWDFFTNPSVPVYHSYDLTRQ